MQRRTDAPVTRPPPAMTDDATLWPQLSPKQSTHNRNGIRPSPAPSSTPHDRALGSHRWWENGPELVGGIGSGGRSALEVVTLDGIRRIARDLRHRRNVEAYVVAAVTLVFAVLSLLGDLAGENLRWAAVLAALGLLVYQMTVPDESRDVDHVLLSRVAFEDVSFESRLKHAKVLWLFAPSGANLLTPARAGELRRTILARPDGVVRIAVLDPLEQAAVDLAAHQLDDAVEYPTHTLAEALAGTVARLDLIASWQHAGQFEARFAAFNPGFSIVAIDPHDKDGTVIVEFHGSHNESEVDRMHVELRRRMSEHWYDYWTDQFEHLWDAGRRSTHPLDDMT
jgi:hypothetical protein